MLNLGNTELHDACYDYFYEFLNVHPQEEPYKYPDNVQRLLDDEVDANALNKEGETPLLYVLRAHHYEKYQSIEDSFPGEYPMIYYDPSKTNLKALEVLHPEYTDEDLKEDLQRFEDEGSDFTDMYEEFERLKEPVDRLVDLFLRYYGLDVDMLFKPDEREKEILQIRNQEVKELMTLDEIYSVEIGDKFRRYKEETERELDNSLDNKFPLDVISEIMKY